MKKTQTLSDLRSHLFDAIERVKSINDPNSSDNEKMSVEAAKAISGLAGNIIESAKVEVMAMQIISKADNPELLATQMKKSDLFIQQNN